MARPNASEPLADGSLPVTTNYEVRRRARVFGVHLEAGLRVREIGGPDLEISPIPATRQLPAADAPHPSQGAHRQGG